MAINLDKHPSLKKACEKAGHIVTSEKPFAGLEQALQDAPRAIYRDVDLSKITEKIIVEEGAERGDLTGLVILGDQADALLAMLRDLDAWKQEQLAEMQVDTTVKVYEQAYKFGAFNALAGVANGLEISGKGIFDCELPVDTKVQRLVKRIEDTLCAGCLAHCSHKSQVSRESRS